MLLLALEFVSCFFRRSVTSSEVLIVRELLLVSLIAITLLTFFSGLLGAPDASRFYSVPEDLINEHYLLGLAVLISTLMLAPMGILIRRARYGVNILMFCYRGMLLLSLGLTLVAANLGGKLVFEHGAGAEQPFTPNATRTVASSAES